MSLRSYGFHKINANWYTKGNELDLHLREIETFLESQSIEYVDGIDHVIQFDFGNSDFRYSMVINQTNNVVMISGDRCLPFGGRPDFETYINCDSINIFSQSESGEYLEGSLNKDATNAQTKFTIFKRQQHDFCLCVYALQFRDRRG